MLFKPNTMIKVAYDMKGNRIYMLNITTGKLYSHMKKFRATNAAVPMGVVLAGGLRSYYSQVYPQLYRDDLSDGFKFLLITITILVGMGLVWIVWRMSYEPQLDVYLEHTPQPEEVKDVNSGLNKAFYRPLISIICMVGFLIGSIYLFSQFLNNSNLMTYVLASAVFLLFLSVATIFKTAIIIIKLAIDMA